MAERKKLFETEAALCAAFIDWAKRDGWTAYAETAGWDIVLVNKDGVQIGVQAKLRFNMDVLSQAVEQGWSSWSQEGPDFRAVLVESGGKSGVCAALGLAVLMPDHHWHHYNGSFRFHPELPKRPGWDNGWWYANPTKRHTLPEYIPDVVAGASGPVQLTRWKIRALRLVATLELRGYITRADFGLCGIDHRRWVNESDWLEVGHEPGTWVRGAGLNFDKQHPDVYPKILEDVRKQLADTPAGALL